MSPIIITKNEAGKYMYWRNAKLWIRFNQHHIGFVFQICSGTEKRYDLADYLQRFLHASVDLGQ